MVVAALSGWHDDHEVAAAAMDAVAALPAHVLLEAYSVLTRLPAGLAVPAATAADVLARRFPEGPLSLSKRDRRGVLDVMAGAGVAGGACYDGLIGLEADAHDHILLTLDRRAQESYRRLGVSFRALA